MARTISTDLRAALNDPARNMVALFTFEFGEGTEGLWTGAGEVEYSGVTYRAGGSVIDVSDIEQSADGSVGEMTLTLSEAPEKGLTTDVLVSLYDYTWHLKPITVQLAFRDPVTLEFVGVQTFFRGLMDEANYTEGPDSAKITAKCVSRSIDLSAAGNLYRNAATQARFDSADTSLNDIGTLNGALEKDSYWGQK